MQTSLRLALKAGRGMCTSLDWMSVITGRHTRLRAMTLLALLSVPLFVVAASSQKAIDTQRSTLTVHVYKAGAFSVFGHEHTVRATIQEGSFDESRKTVEFVVDTRKLQVVDTGISDKDRDNIQSTMLGPKVLDSPRFGEIRFRSTQVSESGGNRWTVNGDLTLHGQTRPVKVDVENQEGRYRGSARLRQSEFGIIPIAAAGGTIKVKDEVRVDFEIMGR